MYWEVTSFISHSFQVAGRSCPMGKPLLEWGQVLHEVCWRLDGSHWLFPSRGAKKRLVAEQKRPNAHGHGWHGARGVSWMILILYDTTQCTLDSYNAACWTSWIDLDSWITGLLVVSPFFGCLSFSIFNAGGFRPDAWSYPHWWTWSRQLFIKLDASA